MKDEAGTLPSFGIEEEGHVCITALIELAAQFSHPRSAYDYSPTLHSVTARLQDALDIAISGNQLPASRCPLCPIALELIQIQNEANDLARNENRWCSILRHMLTFALHGLRSAKQTRMENRLKNIDYRLGEQIIDGHRRTTYNTDNMTSLATRLDVNDVSSFPTSASHSSSMFDNAHGANVAHNTINNVAGDLYYVRLSQWILLPLVLLLLYFCA